MAELPTGSAAEREIARQRPVQWRERFRTYLVAHAHRVRWQRAQGQRADAMHTVLDVAMGEAPDATLSADEAHVRSLWRAFCAVSEARPCLPSPAR